MPHKQEVQQFIRACETLIWAAKLDNRTLTEEEARVVSFYCKEVVEKVVPERLRDR